MFICDFSINTLYEIATKITNVFIQKNKFIASYHNENRLEIQCHITLPKNLMAKFYFTAHKSFLMSLLNSSISFCIKPVTMLLFNCSNEENPDSQRLTVKTEYGILVIFTDNYKYFNRIPEL